MKCLECQTELTQTLGKREKKFCNSTCRSNYWQKQKVLERKLTETNSKTEPENKEEIEKQTNPTERNEIEQMIWEEEQKLILNRKKQ